MSSISVCSRCLRVLRAATRAQTSHTSDLARSTAAVHQKSSHLSSQTSNSRTFSTQTSRWQQAAQTQRKAPSSSQPKSPPGTPSTSSQTQTSDPKPSSASPTNDLSTAQMQKHITTTLSGSRPSLSNNLARTLRTTLPNTATTYLTYGLTESLFKSCALHTAYTIPQSQRTQILSGTGPPKTASGEDIGEPDTSSASATRSFFFSDLNLLPTFSTWSQTTFLHMYLLTVRLRSLPPSSGSTPGSFQNFQQYLLEHFSQSAENHMLLLHTISARGIRNKYLKDLFIQWRGVIAAYDEGLVKGDAVLASAIWRNLFKGDENVDWRKVAMLVAYMRKAIMELEKVKEIGDLPKRLDGPDGVWAKSLVGIKQMVSKDSRGVKENLSAST